MHPVAVAGPVDGLQYATTAAAELVTHERRVGGGKPVTTQTAAWMRLQQEDKINSSNGARVKTIIAIVYGHRWIDGKKKMRRTRWTKNKMKRNEDPKWHSFE